MNWRDAAFKFCSLTVMVFATILIVAKDFSVGSFFLVASFIWWNLEFLYERDVRRK